MISFFCDAHFFRIFNLVYRLFPIGLLDRFFTLNSFTPVGVFVFSCSPWYTFFRWRYYFIDRVFDRRSCSSTLFVSIKICTFCFFVKRLKLKRNRLLVFASNDLSFILLQYTAVWELCCIYGFDDKSCLYLRYTRRHAAIWALRKKVLFTLLIYSIVFTFFVISVYSGFLHNIHV